MGRADGVPGLKQPKATPRLTLRYEDFETFQADVETNLCQGREFVASAGGLARRDACELVVMHPESGDTLSLPAEVVWVANAGSGPGVGLAIHGLGPDQLKRLGAFARRSQRDGVAENVHQRVRGYSIIDQRKAARAGDLAERVALERFYGKSVWETLLQNPRITAPEVTRIARKGNVPRPLLETIAANPSWLASGSLRRALLSNPRLAGRRLRRYCVLSRRRSLRSPRLRPPTRCRCAKRPRS
jgi:hypothetical protein